MFKTALPSETSPQDAPLETAVGSAMWQSERLRKIRSDIQHHLDKLADTVASVSSGAFSVQIQSSFSAEWGSQC